MESWLVIQIKIAPDGARSIHVASGLLAHLIYQATSRDPLVLAGALLAMMLVGLLATWIPARRALAIDPAQLLREE